MATQLTDYAKRAVLNPTPDSESPFTTDGKVGYVLYDSIVIENDGANGAKVSFMWHGHAIAHLNVRGATFENNTMLTLVGLEGRQQVTVGY